MRADRLVAALLILQSRERVAAAELARELEVSERTARRDLEALAMAGVPVYSQPGRHGGWRLIGGARTDLSGLTAPEARALFLLAGPAATTSPEVKAALRKLVKALPAPFRAQATAAAEATLIDPHDWGGRRASPPSHLDVLRQAIIDRVKVQVRYRSRDGQPRERALDPLGMVEKSSTWYLLARTDADEVHTFRVDRIDAIEITTEAAHRPDGFDLDATWRSVTASVEAMRRQVNAVVRATEVVMDWLRAGFGDDLRQERALGDGRIQAQISGSSAERLADQLAGWGADVEVVEPQAVRDALARIGRELVSRYG